jgi:hypothetical protein
VPVSVRIGALFATGEAVSDAAEDQKAGWFILPLSRGVHLLPTTLWKAYWIGVKSNLWV